MLFFKCDILIFSIQISIPFNILEKRDSSAFRHWNLFFFPRSISIVSSMIIHWNAERRDGFALPCAHSLPPCFRQATRFQHLLQQSHRTEPRRKFCILCLRLQQSQIRFPLQHTAKCMIQRIFRNLSLIDRVQNCLILHRKI